MQRLTIGGRLACGVLGVIGGALIGFFAAAIPGVTTYRMPILHGTFDVRDWVFYSAGAFGLFGLVFGPRVGDLLGSALSAFFPAEGSWDGQLPDWLVATLLVLLVVGVWWWMS